ncbi:MAG: primosomal protein N' [Candidatus Yanofskybacteria bacterium]|nr:primosomal protein N' [Candidatus Yanofskybacteria bacterium]
MYILEVIPLTAIPRNQDQILSYFYEEKLPAGALVEVEIRKRKITAVVLASKSLAELKIKLKKEADFELKPIGKILKEQPVLNQHQLNIALWLSVKYFAPLGLCVKAMLPAFLLKRSGEYASSAVRRRQVRRKEEAYSPDLSNQGQKLILTPEKIMAEHFLEKYKKENPVFLSSSTPTKEYFDIWQRVKNGEIKTIVGTRVALFLPFNNLKEIIVEAESNIAYRSDYTPKYDTGILARRTAKEYGAKLIINDSLPKVETYFEFGEETLPQKTKVDISFANMVGEIKNTNFSIFSAELKEQLKSAVQQKNKIIIFVPRKGYAPYLLCQNCGYIPRCPNCDRNLTAFKLTTYNLKPKTILKCHHCQNIQPTLNVCPNCNKSVLEYKGLGIEKAEEKLVKFFKDQNITSPKILALSSDTPQKEEEKIIDQFKNPGPAILLTTQKILSYQRLLKADLVGILNLESLLNFVDFGTEEEALRIVFILSQMTEKTLIQGYDSDARVVKTILSQDFKSFYEEELEARKEFSYPPFAELIKLIFRHQDSRTAEREAEIVRERLNHELGIKNYGKEIEIIGPNAGLKEKGLHTQEIVLKVVKNPIVEPSAHYGARRNELLRLVPSGWQIEVV